MARGRRIKVEEKDYDSLIVASEGKIAKLTNDLKEEKVNLKRLKKDKERYELMKEELAQKERAQKVADMIAASGKSLEEIEAFLAGK